tara:strand:- start:50 stop:544 length:495 start_codon:yes stop_codon:yes gene_type:complete
MRTDIANEGQFVARGSNYRREGDSAFSEAETLKAGHVAYQKRGAPNLIGVKFAERTRIVNTIKTGLGDMNTIEQTGWNRGEIIISAASRGARVKATAVGVKTALRRIRPQEGELLDILDSDIAELEDRLKAAKAERRATLRDAFNAGHVVRLAEVVEVAEELVK